MDMLCIAAAHDPTGYVAVAGRALDSTSLARMTGGVESDVQALLAELDRQGVFSRDRHGRIYSRRMVSDAKKAKQARENGLLGGNPKLRKTRAISASDKGTVNGVLKPQKPEARSQKKKPPNPPDDLIADVTEAIFLLQPPLHRRSPRADIRQALVAAVGRGADPLDVFTACQAHYATPDARKDEGQYAKAAHRLIEKDRWRDYLPAKPVPFSPASAEVQAQRRQHYADTGEWREAWGPVPEEAAA